MKRRKPRRRPHNNTPAPLHATIGERTGVTLNAPKTTPVPQTVMLSPTPKPARDILTWLMAATGLVLAAKPNASIELLPGTPTTVLITSANEARATFVLPISESEARKALGQPALVPRDHDLERLWEEDRRAN